MSNAALSWAFRVPISGVNKAVLIALADHAAEQTGACWPSVARLVLFSGWKERSVRNALRDLETAGIIRTDQSRGRTSSRYVLSLNPALSAALPDDNPASHAGITTVNGAPHAGLDESNPASDATQPGTSYTNPASDDLNPAPHTVNPAPHAPKPLEPSSTPKQPPQEKPGRSNSRGSRLSDDWTPGAEGAKFAQKLGLNPKAIFAVFSDYWKAVPGAKGVKADWQATWNNWCRREAAQTGAKPVAEADLLSQRGRYEPTHLTGGFE